MTTRVFSILPPYNTIEAQLIVGGKLLTNPGPYRVTYQAVADADGSINTTAMGKGNFYSYSAALYGASLSPEQGLAGWSMPGPGNQPQALAFERTNQPAPGVLVPVNWFRAEGIPISPYDDANHRNPYPLMRMIAWNDAQPIATNEVVLPVSDEMDCRLCHGSGSEAAARPAAGWVWSGLPERDFRLNILRLHDEHQFAGSPQLYGRALQAHGFNASGLYRNVVADGRPVLCAACHASEALRTPSFETIPQLTTAVHARHAGVRDPILATSLNDSVNRAACYRCHPGSTTKCLRGAMGAAVSADGSLEMQCQSCHGNMSQVGASDRLGWFMEPNCQSCHTGTATDNMGRIRYSSVFTETGAERVPSNSTFASRPHTPAPGLSLYRFSAGHGGLQCAACHGSTHAEFPSTDANDNRRNIALQGHIGVECTACHTTMPNTPSGGPHGMHAVGQGWISEAGGVTKHADWLELAGLQTCAGCHGPDYRGTVLSRAQADRTLTADLDGSVITLNLSRGAQVGCYACHNGPDSSNPTPAVVPVAANLSTNMTNDRPLTLALTGTGTGLTWRIIRQPANGTVGISNNVANYVVDPGFVGTDTFTFAAYNGAHSSNLATGTVVVAQGPFSLSLSARVPPNYPAGWPVPFTVVPSAEDHRGAVTLDWDFGDGSQHEVTANTTHTYTQPGTYQWSVEGSIAGTLANRTGTLVVGSPMVLTATRSGNLITVSWPNTIVDTLLQATEAVGQGSQWTALTNKPRTSATLLSVTLPAEGNKFLRLSRPW